MQLPAGFGVVACADGSLIGLGEVSISDCREGQTPCERGTQNHGTLPELAGSPKSSGHRVIPCDPFLGRKGIMRPHLRLRTLRPRRIYACAALLLALLGTTGIISLGVDTALPSRSDAATEIFGSYGAGRLMAVDPNGGYWIASFLGTVTPYDGAPTLGSPASLDIHLSKPIVGMAPTQLGGATGWWLGRGHLQFR